MKMKLMSNVLKERERKRRTTRRTTTTKTQEELIRRRRGEQDNSTTKQINRNKTRRSSSRILCVRTNLAMWKNESGSRAERKGTIRKALFYYYYLQMVCISTKNVPLSLPKTKEEQGQETTECAIKVRFTMKIRKTTKTAKGYQKDDHFGEMTQTRAISPKRQKWCVTATCTHTRGRMTVHDVMRKQKVWFVCVRVIGRANNSKRDKETATDVSTTNTRTSSRCVSAAGLFWRVFACDWCKCSLFTFVRLVRCSRRGMYFSWQT